MKVRTLQDYFTKRDNKKYEELIRVKKLEISR